MHFLSFLFLEMTAPVAQVKDELGEKVQKLFQDFLEE